jgi:hypothetical protein
MPSNPNPEARDRWLWWMCGFVLLTGMALGWRTVHWESEPLPVLTFLTAPEPARLRLDHPLPGRVAPANSSGNLRIWLYSGRELAGPPLAEVVESPAFDNGTSWLGPLINEKLGHVSDNFSMTMRGWVTFSAFRTMVHIRSDNGFRIRFRNGLGQEQKLEHWVDDVTEDYVFCAVAERGRYQIEIDYFNGVGGFFFKIWTTPQTEFEPATDPSPATR